MCHETKENTDFYLGTRRGSNYLYSRCKACCKVLNDSYKERGRDWELQKKYGISLEEYQKQVKSRDSVCDICLTYTKVMHVDHCHTTGKIRGYLCGSCNRGIGLLKDNSQVCKNAALYLEK